MIHRVVYGSIERFIGILTEHFAGKFPVWLAPTQAKVLLVSEKCADYGRKVYEALRAAKVRVEIDDRFNIDDFQEIERLRKSVMAKLRSVCQLEIPVRFVSPGSLKRFEGKARRVTDLRETN